MCAFQMNEYYFFSSCLLLIKLPRRSLYISLYTCIFNFDGVYVWTSVSELQCMHKFNFCRSYQPLFQSGYTVIHFLQKYVKDFVALPTMGIINIFNFSHWGRYVMLFYCDFTFHLPLNEVEYLFKCLLFVWMFFFCEVSL